MFMRASAPAYGAVPMIFLRMALVGIVFTALPFVSLGYASHFLSAGTIAIIQAGAPIFAAVIAHIGWQRKITGVRALGLLVGTAITLRLLGPPRRPVIT